MPKAKPLSKELIMAAVNKTKSNRAAARYLNVSFSPDKLKYRLITEGYLLEECASCGFHERRVLDYKMPLLLHFKDGNKKNYRKENTELLCYNHFFLTVGDIFSNKQLKGIEDHVPVNQGDVEWELDEYQKQRLTELGLHNEKDDGLDLISRI